MKVALLNTPICTTYGVFAYAPISRENAKLMIEANGFESYIGHQATADILSTLFGIDVSVNRAEYVQQGGLIALVFKLNTRMTEPRELTVDEIEEIGYTLGTLKRLDGSSISEDFERLVPQLKGGLDYLSR